MKDVHIDTGRRVGDAEVKKWGQITLIRINRLKEPFVPGKHPLGDDPGSVFTYRSVQLSILPRSFVSLFHEGCWSSLK